MKNRLSHVQTVLIMFIACSLHNPPHALKWLPDATTEARILASSVTVVTFVRITGVVCQ